ncbi:MAG TPA: ergothioneine biosynthesis protein EgtB [Thermoanaerobaculia bacterium]|jgi:iron(II)-dependent oxidoreductase|nr:ergothioneine biosynthesis protein EgtB [Thermoanaerobaculia bacterium]
MELETAPAAARVDREAVARRMADVRQRTLELIAVLDSATLRRQHIPILSPMVWDVGHIGNFEEQWIGQRLAGLPPVADGYQKMFDPVANPRPTRAALPLPTGEELANYLGRVREQTLRVLESGADGGEPRLVADGFVYEMVVEHEEQHQETLLQAMQVLSDPPYAPQHRRPLPSPRALGRNVVQDMVRVDAGPFRMGWQRGGFAYDNELPPHEVQVAAFEIDRFPVTHGDYLAFVQDGGYRRRELWQPAGWAFREQEALEAPRHWQPARSVGRIGAPFGEAWLARFMDRIAPVEEVADLPIVHVCYWEADAYARWAGKRLPTEAEWEKAALWDPATQRARPWPWGEEPPDTTHANLDQLGFAPAPIGAYPSGASAYGVEQLVGDCWEWTSSDFGGYPGFEAYPYDDYSKSWFGSDYKVLRGASWATRPAVARGTFRNWDYPIRRQIFAGFRLAQSVEAQVEGG